MKIEELKKNENVQLISWWIACTFIFTIVLHHLKFSFQYAIIDSLVTNGLLLVISLVMKQMQNYFHSKSVITLLNGGVIAAFSISFILVYRHIGSLFLPSLEWSKHANQTEFIIRGCFAFLLLTILLFKLWITKNNSFQTKNTDYLIDIERQLNKAELINIQQQLQPHFLFNSLNSISALTIVEPEEARRMVHLLSDFLRGTLSKNHEQLVKLSEEITYLNLYLEIEKVRFGHRLQIDLQIDEACINLEIPTFILQPIVENSIKYGLYGQIGELIISIKSHCENNQLTISISNPYEEETVNASKGIGFGLTSIQKKMYLLYGRKDLLQIDKKDNLFTTTLIIPQK